MPTSGSHRQIRITRTTKKQKLKSLGVVHFFSTTCFPDLVKAMIPEQGNTPHIGKKWNSDSSFPGSPPCSLLIGWTRGPSLGLPQFPAFLCHGSDYIVWSSSMYNTSLLSPLKLASLVFGGPEPSTRPDTKVASEQNDTGAQSGAGEYHSVALPICPVSWELILQTLYYYEPIVSLCVNTFYKAREVFQFCLLALS